MESGGDNLSPRRSGIPGESVKCSERVREFLARWWMCEIERMVEAFGFLLLVAG